MAITLSKKLAKELKEKLAASSTESATKQFEDYLPDADEIESIKQRYKSLASASKNKDNVGKVM
jgi:hypothetical protein